MLHAIFVLFCKLAKLQYSPPTWRLSSWCFLKLFCYSTVNFIMSKQIYQKSLDISISIYLINKTVGEFLWFFLHIKRVPSTSDKMSYRSGTVYYWYQKPAAMGPVHIRFVDREGELEGNKWYVLIFVRCDFKFPALTFSLIHHPTPPPQAHTYSRTRSARSYEFPFPNSTSPPPPHFFPPPTPIQSRGLKKQGFLDTSWRLNGVIRNDKRVYLVIYLFSYLFSYLFIYLKKLNSEYFDYSEFRIPNSVIPAFPTWRCKVVDKD